MSSPAASIEHLVFSITIWLALLSPLCLGVQQHAFVQVNARSSFTVANPASRKKGQGKWLFGSLTCPLDVLAVDQMLPHQLLQSAGRPFDHRVLYVSSATNKANTTQRESHAAMLERVRTMQLVDEMVMLDDVKPLELARRSMEVNTATAFVALPSFSEYNKAMVAFLAQCLDGGFDQCAWLDGDIFVHRGSKPWVDEAAERSIEDPQIVVQMPQHSLAHNGFSSRYFIYHRQGLQRLLPLTGVPDDTFEALVGANLAHVSNWQGHQRHSSSGSWVIHPPDASADLHHILQDCIPGTQPLHSLIAIVEEGSENGDGAFWWRDKHSDENMDIGNWVLHMRHHCEDHSFTKSLLQLVGSQDHAPARTLKLHR